MKSFVFTVGLGSALTLGSFACGQEIETFDSPNQLQGGSNFTFSPPIQGSWAVAKGGTVTDRASGVEITGSTGYGTAYKSIYGLDTPPPGGTNGVVSILGSTTLQLDLTITTGDAGPFVDLQDGEGDFYQYFYGYGLVGGAANNAPPQEPGETITQGATPNELILDVPLATPYSDLGGTGTFDFSQITLFRLEDDPGGNGAFDIQFNDLSGVTVPEPASIGALSLGALAMFRRRSRI